jgi:hypothetical protein
MKVLLATFQKQLINAICYRSIRSSFACWTGKWRATRLYAQLPAHPSTQGQLTVTLEFITQTNKMTNDSKFNNVTSVF